MTNTQNQQRTIMEGGARQTVRKPWAAMSMLLLTGALTTAGCYNNPIETSDFERGPAPLRMPAPTAEGQTCECYEDSLTGGQVFTMYCSYCHNAPNLGERPFASFQNVAAHMRVRANLTGKEYAKLMVFLRQWHDVPPADGLPEPTPKRLTFPQPLAELRPQLPAQGKQEAQPAPPENQGQ